MIAFALAFIQHYNYALQTCLLLDFKSIDFTNLNKTLENISPSCFKVYIEVNYQSQ